MVLAAQSLLRSQERCRLDDIFEYGRRNGTYVAQRGAATTLVSFFHATTSGLLSMQPPKATAAHVTLTGAAMDKNTSKGAAAASGMARLYTTPLVASVHETIFCP